MKSESPFNPLPSHEGRPPVRLASKPRMVFQSTSLSRGKTAPGECRKFRFPSFNPLPSHEGRRFVKQGQSWWTCLSIHFPLTREDRSMSSSLLSPASFQSTSLSRGKTIFLPQSVFHRSFQSTSLSRGKTFAHHSSSFSKSLSIHFPLTREDT